MGKTQIINEIIKIYDENADLKTKLEKNDIAIAANKGVGDLAQIDNFAGLTAVCIDIGRTKIWNSAFDTYELKNSKFYFEENKLRKYLDFDEWCNSLSFSILHTTSYDQETKYILSLLRDYSITEVIRYFRVEFKNFYDKQIAAIKMEYVRNAKEND